MHDPGLMRPGEALGNGHTDLESVANEERPGPEELAQGLALDELHGDPRSARRGPDFVHGDDRRMVERRGRLRLFFETTQPRRVRADIPGEHLDGNVASEPRVAGAVDLAHAAGAEKRTKLVVSQARPRQAPLRAHPRTAHRLRVDCVETPPMK